MTFATLYGIELDRELASTDTTQRFTTARRKAAINAAQLEFVERTECLQKQASLTLVDDTQEYDLEVTATDFLRIATQGVSIAISNGTTTRYIEGDDLEVTTVERLNVEEPGWRGVSASTPAKVYPRMDGGRRYLGLHPKPSIDTDAWTLLLPYVIIPADMSADGDKPFTVSSNSPDWLRPYHRALVHFAAFDLEKLRKDSNRGASQLQLFESYVERYKAGLIPKGGRSVRYARNYRRPMITRSTNPRA